MHRAFRMVRATYPFPKGDNAMDSFSQAVTNYVKAAKSGIKAQAQMSVTAAMCYAIGFLSGKSKTDINNEVRTAGDFSDQDWKSAKVPLSHAHRAIAGEYGFGDDLAQMWARGDFSITLDAAYKASKPPVDAEEMIDRLVKELLGLNAEDRDAVISRVAVRINEMQENDGRRPERFASLRDSILQKVTA